MLSSIESSIDRVLLLKFENYVLLLSLMDSAIDVVNGITQNDISLTFEKSNVMSAGKQSDIILKFENADTVKVEGSKTTEVSNLRHHMLSSYVANGRKQNDIIRKVEKSDVISEGKLTLKFRGGT